MKMVRFGIIGTGFMGGNHAAWLHAGNISGACLTAVCDIAPARLDWARQTFGDEVAIYQDYHELPGACSRSFYVGDAVEPEDVSAKFEDGILTISVPKNVKKQLPKNSAISIQ